MKIGDVEKLVEALQEETEFCWFCEEHFNINKMKCPCKTEKQCAKQIVCLWRLKNGV